MFFYFFTVVFLGIGCGEFALAAPARLAVDVVQVSQVTIDGVPTAHISIRGDAAKLVFETLPKSKTNSRTAGDIGCFAQPKGPLFDLSSPVDENSAQYFCSMVLNGKGKALNWLTNLPPHDVTYNP